MNKSYEKLNRSPPEKDFRILKTHILGFGEPIIQPQIYNYKGDINHDKRDDYYGA